MPKKRLRVLVIEDSAYNRLTLVSMLEAARDILVVATAKDGEAGLQAALELAPDVITLDLSLPGIDGFAFLRLLTAKRATPVIVVSGYSRKSDVFKALELGAFDFVAKPSMEAGEDLGPIREELLGKIRAVRHLRREAPPRPASAPLRVVAIGASTGGPPALQRVFAALPDEAPLCLLVAQHMPPRFTAAFAERLNKRSPMEVAEAQGGELLAAGRAFVAPGGGHLRVRRGAGGLMLEVHPRAEKDTYVPSIDGLLTSLAVLEPTRTLGVLLTGMGSDGTHGLLALRRAGAHTVAESEETAAIFGMPKEAIEAGAAEKVLPLTEIIAEIVRFGRS